MRLSECNQTTCCQIGDKWYFYLSKEKCIQDQKQPPKSIDTNTTNTIPPQSQYQSVYLTSMAYSVNCKSNVVDALKTADQALKKAQDENKICRDKAFQDYLTCREPCFQSSDYASCSDSCYNIQNLQYVVCDNPLNAQKEGFKKVLDSCFK